METFTNTIETTLRDYLKVLFKHKAVIITPVIILMLTVYIGIELFTPALSHTARVKMTISGMKLSVAPYYKGLSPGEIGGLLAQEREIIESTAIIARTVGVLGLHNLPLDYEMRFSSGLKALFIEYKVKKLKHRLEGLPPERKQALLFNRAVEDLKKRVKMEPIRGANMFTIEVSDFSPTGAVIIANVLSRIYVIYDLERQLAEFRLQYGEKYPLTLQVKDKIEKLQKHLDGRPLQDIEAIGPASVKIIEQAKEATPVRPRYNKRLMLTLTFFLSAVLGIMFAFGFEYLNQTLKSPQDIEKYLNIPFLGSIPKRKSKDKLLIEDANPTNSYTQFYQNLSEQLYLLINDRNLRSILIVDAESSSDTTAVIANIGKCVARREDYKVLIIDANLRNPLVSKVFNTLNSPGLTDVLEGKILFEDAIHDLGSNLTVLTAGQTVFNPTTLLGSFRMSEVIKTAKEKYEVLFLASADLKNFTDALILSSIVDGIVLVVNEGKTRRQVIKALIAPLEQKKANLIGAVLNNRTFALPKIIYDRT